MRVISSFQIRCNCAWARLGRSGRLTSLCTLLYNSLVLNYSFQEKLIIPKNVSNVVLCSSTKTQNSVFRSVICLLGLILTDLWCGVYARLVNILAQGEGAGNAITVCVECQCERKMQVMCVQNLKKWLYVYKINI